VKARPGVLDAFKGSVDKKELFANKASAAANED
jgi:hypothetical protein